MKKVYVFVWLLMSLFQAEGFAAPFLIGWDFDGTLVTGHVHSMLADAEIEHNIQKTEEPYAGMLSELIGSPISEELDALVNNILARSPFQNQNETVALFREALRLGDKLAIVTFSKYPQIIAIILKKIGLNESELAQIYLRTGYPKERRLRKGEHLKDAQDHFQITDSKQVILVDDDVSNVTEAREKGNNGIWVRPEDNKYLEELKKILETRIIPTHISPRAPYESPPMIRRELPMPQMQLIKHSRSS